MKILVTILAVFLTCACHDYVDWTDADTDADAEFGGETIHNAIVIDSLPFVDSKNSCDFENDYDESCPFPDGIAPDVVYSFTPDKNMVIDVDLCDVDYNSKAYVYDSYWADFEIACNDNNPCGAMDGSFGTLIEGLEIYAGITYYIVIDGYWDHCGDYNLLISE